VAIVAAVVKKTVDFVGQVSQKDTNAVAKQVIAWVTGVGGAFLLQHSDFATQIQATSVLTLADASWGTVVLFGLGIASTASAGNDLLAAVDPTRSSAAPPVIDAPNAALKANLGLVLPGPPAEAHL